MGFDRPEPLGFDPLLDDDGPAVLGADGDDEGGQPVGVSAPVEHQALDGRHLRARLARSTTGGPRRDAARKSRPNAQLKLGVGWVWVNYRQLLTTVK